jgi:hypothetical protein
MNHILQLGISHCRVHTSNFSERVDLVLSDLLNRYRFEVLACDFLMPPSVKSTGGEENIRVESIGCLRSGAHQ